MSSNDLRMGQLPYDLLERYQAYKKATATVVTWIIQNGDIGDDQSYRLPINQLRMIAENIKRREVEVPLGVHQAFGKAIASRKRVAKHFRRAEPSRITNSNPQTLSHEHFTESLEAIFHILCSPEQSNLKIPVSNALLKPSANHCEPLEGLVIDSDTDHTEINASVAANTTKTDKGLRNLLNPLGKILESLTMICFCIFIRSLPPRK